MLGLYDQICSLEYAKKFKELGIKQKSLFYYVSNDDKEYEIAFAHNDISLLDYDKEFAYRYSSVEAEGYVRAKYIYSAFTVAELEYFFPHEFEYSVTINKGNLLNEFDGIQLFAQGSITLGNNHASILALLLIENIKKGTIKVENVNKYF